MIFKNNIIIGSSLLFGRTPLNSQENELNLIWLQPAGCCVLMMLVLWLSLPGDMVPVGYWMQFSALWIRLKKGFHRSLRKSISLVGKIIVFILGIVWKHTAQKSNNYY